MGCDIHLAVEVRKNGKWERRLPPPEARVPHYVEKAREDPDAWYANGAMVTWYDERNYDCFAILANVCNGHGFAGIPTGGGFVPSSAPRGMPKDVSTAVARLHPDHPKHEAEASDDIWLGDHSHSWLLLSELLDYDWTQVTTKTGCITLAAFAERIEAKTTEPPEEYCGSIMGKGIVTLSRAQALEQLHGGGVAVADGHQVYVFEEWTITYAKAAGAFYSRTLPALKALAECEGISHKNVRIVFGFDS